MELSARQRRALEAIVDTFLPATDGLPSATQLDVPARLLELIEANPRVAERKQVLQLLTLWDGALLTALGGGGFKRFSALDQAAREKVLLSWADSRLPQRRAAFKALRNGALLCAYGAPAPGQDGNPLWERSGYPGVKGAPADAPAPPLDPVTPTAPTTLECDVVIVGSGAGGGTAAGVLASAGLDVIVVEAGGYYDDKDFDGEELSAFKRFYTAGPGSSHDGSIGLVAGAALGGGTVVNYTTSFKTPDRVRDEWAAHGVPAFAAGEYAQSLNAVVERLGVNLEHGAASSRDAVLERACQELGWHVDAMPRNVRGCDQGEQCGYCGLGCRLGAKQSTAKTWLVDAANAGARMLVRTKVSRVLVKDGAAVGVEGVAAGGHAVTVMARAVVAAAGAIQTAALLKRSGLKNPNVGRNLWLHPVSPVFGVLDEAIEPWYGSMQSRYSTEHADLDGDGYGVIYETGSLQHHILVPFAPWRGAAAHRTLMDAHSHTVAIAALVRDRDSVGEVRVDKSGEPVVRYKLGKKDTEHLRFGTERVAEMLETAGARRIYSPHLKWVSYDPGVDGDRARFMRDADAAGWGPGQITMGSFHIMGTARMGGTPQTSATKPTGETWEARSLYVCDASCFPTASGVNPMVSIEAIAHLNATGLAAALA